MKNDIPLAQVQESAENGNLEAQYELALRYYYGKDTKVNGPQALKWFSRAAEQGHGMSMFRLGRLYHEMKHNQANLESAVKWLTMAASQGIFESAVYLGNLYTQAPMNSSESRMNAYMWYNVAMMSGDEDSREMCREMVDQLSPEELKEAVARAKAFVSSLDRSPSGGPAVLS